ncbi:hypothetical protein MUP79_00825 [Candidatus Bathyarchaeota archaeon]|jgi:hypothetical protein|nr:hypothetical protein [Candidatus Bathyarchaeota archaeon]
MSLTLWLIITKDTKEATAAPTMKIKNAVKTKKFEKIDERPGVRLPSTLRDIPKPNLSAKRRRKTVDPAHRLNPRMAKPV